MISVNYYNTKTKEPIGSTEEYDHCKHIFKRAKELMKEMDLKSISFTYDNENVTLKDPKYDE